MSQPRFRRLAIKNPCSEKTNPKAEVTSSSEGMSLQTTRETEFGFGNDATSYFSDMVRSIRITLDISRETRELSFAIRISLARGSSAAFC